MLVVDILGATLAPPPIFRHLNGRSLHFPENNSPFAAVLELMPTRRGKRASSKGNLTSRRNTYLLYGITFTFQMIGTSIY